MHEFTPEQIELILDCLDRSQPQADLPASVMNCVRTVASFVLAPTVVQIDEAHYFSLPGTNLTLIARPAGNGRCHWSGLTTGGVIYNSDLVELVKIFLNEDGREQQFLVEQVSVRGSVIWVDGRYEFSLNGGAK